MLAEKLLLKRGRHVFIYRSDGFFVIVVVIVVAEDVLFAHQVVVARVLLQALSVFVVDI